MGGEVGRWGGDVWEGMEGWESGRVGGSGGGQELGEWLMVEG